MRVRVDSDDNTASAVGGVECHGGRAGNRRDWSLGLLFTAYALSLFDRQIINVLAQDIKIDLHLSDTELGLLAGSAFGIFYSIFGIPLGRLADRLDRVKLIAAAVVMWSGFTVSCAMAGSFLQLFLTRVGVGVGEAGSQPAATALIADLVPERRRTSAMSFLMIGAPVGSFLGLMIGGFVGSRWGWRSAFVLAGLPGFALSFLIIATMRDPRSVATATQCQSGSSLPGALRMIVGTPDFRRLVTMMTCSAFLVYASGAWLPPFFVRVHGMTTAQVGAYSAFAVGVGGAIGTLGGGLLCDRLRSNIANVEVKILLVSLGLCFPALVAVVLSPDRSLALLSYFLFNIFAFVWLGPTMTQIQKAVALDARSLAIALSGASANIISLGLGVPIVGLISDALAPSLGRDSIAYALLICAAFAVLIGTVAIWRLLLGSVADLDADATAGKG